MPIPSRPADASTPERIARVRLAIANAFAGLTEPDARDDMADAVLRAVHAQVALALRQT